MHKSTDQTYYEVLDLEHDATIEEIELAYKLTKKAFSDNSLAVYSLFDAEETKAMLKKIEEAYQVLSSHEKKRQYDEEVLGIVRKKTVNDLTPTSVSHDYLSIEQAKEQAKIVTTPKRENEKVESSSLKGFTTSLYRNDKETFKTNSEFEEKIIKATRFTGAFLKEIREYRKMSINEIATITKINPDYLNAIEEFNLQKLPAKVYLMGFLKQYAKLLKLDTDKVSEGYLKLIEESKNG